MFISLIAALWGCGAPSDAPAPTVASATAKLDIPQRADDADRASKNGHLVHTVRGATLDVRFGRPSANGRALFGELVPYGSVWRTGANEATTIAFDTDVRVNRAALPAGVYALFTIPYPEEWIVIFNRNVGQWGASQYMEDDDALRLAIKPNAAEFVETFDVRGTEEGFELRWGDVAVPVQVHAEN